MTKPDLYPGHPGGIPHREATPPKEDSLATQWRKIRADARALHQQIIAPDTPQPTSPTDLMSVFDQISSLKQRYAKFTDKLTGNQDIKNAMRGSYVSTVIQPLVNEFAQEPDSYKTTLEQLASEEGTMELLSDLKFPYSITSELGAYDEYTDYDPRANAIKSMVEYFKAKDLEQIGNSLLKISPENLHNDISNTLKSMHVDSTQESRLTFLAMYDFFWWQVIKKSPQLVDIFEDKEFQTIDHKVYNKVLVDFYDNHSESYDNMWRLLYYPTHDAVRKILFEGSRSDVIRKTPVHVLNILARGDDWEENVRKMEQDERNADMLDDFSVLRNWKSLDENQKVIALQATAITITTSLIRDEEKKTDKDQSFLHTLYFVLPTDNLVSLFAEAEYIPESLAQTFLNALTVLKEAGIYAKPFHYLIQYNLLRSRGVSPTDPEYNIAFKLVPLAEKIIEKKGHYSELRYLAASDGTYYFPYISPELFFALPKNAPILLQEGMEECIGSIFNYKEQLLRNVSDYAHLQGILSELKIMSTGTALHVLRGYMESIKEQKAFGDTDRDSIFDSYRKMVRSLFEDTDLLTSLQSLIDVGGPLHTNKEKIITSIFTSKNFRKRAQEIVGIFTKPIPYWKQLFLFTDTRLAHDLAQADSQYPIDFFPKIKRAIGGVFDFSEDFTFFERPISRMSVQEKRAIADFENLSDSEVAALTKIPFIKFRPEFKRIIFAYLLSQTVEKSRNQTSKIDADQRNHTFAKRGLKLTEGMYLHGSSVDVLDNILLNGNLPGEALGEAAKTDSYPFHVDFSRILGDALQQSSRLDEYFKTLIATGRGNGGKFKMDGQMLLLYDRHNSSWQPHEHGTGSPEHALMLGGIPATEISGIVLQSPDATLELVKKSIVENGFYIPVYARTGKLLFGPSEYDRIRRKYNMQIAIETWDYSLKTSDKRGSNPGGEYVIATTEGARKYYVKFLENVDHIWSEQLADNIYSRSGIPVPNTKVVKIEGEYGHASEMVEKDEQGSETQLKDGYIVDAFLANWDIVMSRNTASSGGKLLRLDNGGSLLFRAQGARKRIFGATVIELETMRGSYPGLTSEDIKYQVSRLRETMTNQAINEEVDRVRLSKKDRDLLKATLKQRRDYILSYNFEEEISEATSTITQQGNSFITQLQTSGIADDAMVSLVPEWEKLVSEEGYQHNKVLLGNHIKDAVKAVKDLPEFKSLTAHEQMLTLTAMFFHDIAKPTGGKEENVRRDFDHEIPSAQIAAEYMLAWNFSIQDIKRVVQAILYDGIVSDIARDKVRDSKKNLSPDELKNALRSKSSIQILRAVNAADVIATVGKDRFDEISHLYNAFFDAMLT